MKTVVNAAVACGLVLCAASAQAATYTFDFTSSGYEKGQELSFTEGDLTLDVTASNYGEPSNVGDDLVEYSDFQVARYEGYGLYVTYRGDNDHRIDGWYNELVKFNFSKDVVVDSITFGSIEEPSYFDLFVEDDGTLVYEGSQQVVTPLDLGVHTDHFGVGASEHAVVWTRECSTRGHGYYYHRTKKKCVWVKELTYSAFKITSVTVSHKPTIVPLPAAGWALLAGLGGLVVLRRKTRA
ncbi:MAG: VPLPA-CTERM sorting domain-containing protein [Pseudomonadota bacterium]